MLTFWSKITAVYMKYKTLAIGQVTPNINKHLKGDTTMDTLRF